MNTNIIEAIKTNNLDLFKLLFDYNKLDISVENSSQLYDEVLLSMKRMYDPWTYKGIAKITTFKYLFNPNDFLDLCFEYKSNDILLDYMIQTRDFGKKLAGDNFMYSV